MKIVSLENMFWNGIIWKDNVIIRFLALDVGVVGQCFYDYFQNTSASVQRQEWGETEWAAIRCER